MKRYCFNLALLISFAWIFCSCDTKDTVAEGKTPVDYVNPYIGNISHILVPTFPTVHLPNSMLRVYPERREYSTDVINGLPVIVTSHRGSSAFNISPVKSTEDMSPVRVYSYDDETIMPYRYSVHLDNEDINVDFAPSHQSAVYSFDFGKNGKNTLVINTRNGELKYEDGAVSGFQMIDKGLTKVYVYIETRQKSQKAGALREKEISTDIIFVEGVNQALALQFDDKIVNLRYGISFISAYQAKKNLQREINTYSVDEIADTGRQIWNDRLGKIQIEGGSESQKTVFYTSLYRTYERMINISEDGKYYSAFDNTIHEDNGTPFYTDDWLWDTYRATHPLRILIETDMEQHMIQSHIRMAQQSKEGWMPTFPEVTGDSHRMNGNHAVAVVWDAYAKGLRGFDLEVAYNACKASLTEKSLCHG